MEGFELLALGIIHDGTVPARRFYVPLCYVYVVGRYHR